MIRPTRRSFLKSSLAGIASFLAGVWSWVGCRLPRRRPPAWAGLPPDRRAILAAASRRLVPPAASIDAIERALRDYYVPIRDLFARGADELDRRARADWGAAFVDLDGDAQDRILSFVQTGRADANDFDGGLFVNELLALTIEGFLGDPRHGGNAGEAGWNFIGYWPGGPRCHDR